MATKKISAKPKKNTFGMDLIEAMKLVVDHRRGKFELEQALTMTNWRTWKPGNSRYAL